MPITYLQHRISISNFPYIKKHKISHKSFPAKSSNSNQLYILSVVWILICISNFIITTGDSNAPSYKYDLSINMRNSGMVSGNNIEHNYDRYLQIFNNRLTRSINGNRVTNKGLNIIQLNKGNANFETKINSIQRIIDNEKPDIICISESNIKKSKIDNINHFPEYNHELNLMSNNIDISRNSILIKKSLNYKRRYEYESNEVCNIWVEIFLNKGKSLMLMGGYRTWSSLKAQNIINSNSNKNQLKRFKITLDNWARALSEDKDTIVCIDDNIDSSDGRHNKKYNIHNLHNLLTDHLNTYSIAQCNNEYTRITSHQHPSTIDKIYTNKPNKMTNIRTMNNIDSDHKFIVARYLCNEPAYHPKFIKKRDYTNLTYCKINEYVTRSEILDTVFQSEDSDYIAETLHMELNAIYNTLAPSSIVQYKHNYIPYYNKEILEEIRLCENLLTSAIKSNERDNWRQYRNSRNILNKNIKIAKSKFLNQKLTEKNNNLKFLKGYHKQGKCNPPQSIIIMAQVLLILKN